MIIQAGGRSTRMGQDKGLVELAGRPLVKHVLERVRDLGDEILLVTNHPQNYPFLNLPMIGDAEPGAGAAPGLLTALSAAHHDCVVVAGVDMPFVSADLFRDLLGRLKGDTAAVLPVSGGFWQPLHAVYRRSLCLEHVKKRLASGKLSLRGVLDGLNLVLVEHQGDGRPFVNINTPRDLERARQLIAQTGSDRRP